MWSADLAVCTRACPNGGSCRRSRGRATAKAASREAASRDAKLRMRVERVPCTGGMYTLAASSCMASAVVDEKDCAKSRERTPKIMGVVAYT